MSQRQHMLHNSCTGCDVPQTGLGGGGGGSSCQQHYVTPWHHCQCVICPLIFPMCTTSAPLASANAPCSSSLCRRGGNPFKPQPGRIVPPPPRWRYNAHPGGSSVPDLQCTAAALLLDRGAARRFCGTDKVWSSQSVVCVRSHLTYLGENFERCM